MTELRAYEDHQIEMHKYGVSTKHPAMIVEMRLGKTLVMVRVVQELNDSKHILVICPTSAFRAWNKELTLEGESYIRGYGCPVKKRRELCDLVFKRDKRTWFITNYETIPHFKDIVDMKWDYVILDESINIKSPSTITSKLIANGFRSAKHRAILVGLMSTENLLEPFQQFKFLVGKFLGYSNFYNFRTDLFEPGYTSYDWFPKEGVAKMIKYFLHKRCFILTRKQAGKVKTKKYIQHSVEMTPEQTKLYKQVEKEFAYEYDSLVASGINDTTIWSTEKAIWCHRIAGGYLPDGKTKISDNVPKQILYLLQNDLQKQQVVIMYRFIAELKGDAEFLKSKGFTVSCLHGMMNEKTKEIEEEKFVTGQTQLMLCMQKMCAKSKDFSNASTIIYRSNEASCDLRAQSEDRILNDRKNDVLLLIDIVVDDTVVEEVVNAVKEKVWNAKSLHTQFKSRRNGQKTFEFFN